MFKWEGKLGKKDKKSLKVKFYENCNLFKMVQKNKCIYLKQNPKILILLSLGISHMTFFAFLLSL